MCDLSCFWDWIQVGFGVCMLASLMMLVAALAVILYDNLIGK